MNQNRRKNDVWISLLIVLAIVPSVQAFDTDSPYAVVGFVPGTLRWNAMQDAGIGWVRCDFTWPLVEATQGVYDWTLTDNEVAEANARGLHIYAGLGYTPAWASAGHHSYDPPTNYQNWYNYITACVNRYKGSVHHWEMWNEPNLSQFWGGNQSQYITILKGGADAAHAADPDCMVLAPEVSSCCNTANWMTTALTQAGDKIDIICYHQYDGGDTPSGRISAIDSMHNTIINAGYGNKPLWITESGWRSDNPGMTEALQGQYLAGMLAGMPSRLWWKKYFWYQIWEGGAGTEKWGLLYQNETHKPSWTSYHDYTVAHPAPQMVSVNLSTTDIVNGINLVTVADGNTTPDTIASRSCRRNTNAAGGDGFIYFNVNDTFAFQGNRPAVIIYVDYYDGGTGSLAIEYDSNTGNTINDFYRVGGSVALAGKNTWKQAIFSLTNAYFGNRQNNGADFRLSNGGNTFYVDVVQVDAAPLPADTTPPTLGSSINPTLTNSTTPPAITISAQDTGNGLDVSSAEFAYSWDGGTTTTTYVGRYVLHSKGTGSGGANQYWYPDFYHPGPSYTVVSGDYLFYDIYTKNPAGTASGAVDLEGDFNLRDSGIADQNGRNAHPNTDLSSVALNQWYHREFNLSSMAGLTVADFEMGHEIDNGTSEFYVRNVLIVNNGVVKLKAANNETWTSVSESVGPGNDGYTATVGPEMLIGDPASPASCTGNNGTTAQQTVTAAFVAGKMAPLLAGSNNRIWFHISDLNANRQTSSAFTITVDTTPPTVSSVVVVNASHVNVTFNEANGMGGGVTTASNYTVSGSGKGTLSNNPGSVALLSGTTYQLTWPACSGGNNEMKSGGNITITVSAGVQDAVGNGLGSPNNATDTGHGVGTAPSISSCGANTSTSANASCQASLPNLSGDVTASDSCGGTVTKTQIPASGTTVGLGVTVVTIIATDPAGNAANCTKTYTVNGSAACCTSAANCDDGNACTTDTCVSNACQHAPSCIRHPIAWRSIRSHAGIGDLPIALNATATGNNSAGSGGPNIETRGTAGAGGVGITRMQVDFNGSASAPNAAQITVTGYATTYPGGIPTLGGPTSYSPATVFMVDSDTMEMTFSPPLPDQRCFIIALGQNIIAEQIDLGQDHDVVIRVLNGDANLNGTLTISDLLLTKSKAGTTIDAGANVGNAIYDDDLSGGITSTDAMYCKTQMNAQLYARAALCP